MGDVTLAIFRSPADASPFYLDAVIEPVLTRALDVSSYPREDGTEATEHARIRPAVYRFRGLLVNEPVDDDAAQRRSSATIAPTNTPNNGPFSQYGGRDFRDPLISARILGPQVDDSRALNLYLELVDIMEAREPVDVFTPTIRIKQGLIRDLSQRFVGKSALEVFGTIEQVVFANTAGVNLKPVPAPPRKKKSTRTEKEGVKGKTEATPQETAKAKSVTAAFFDAARRAF